MVNLVYLLVCSVFGLSTVIGNTYILYAIIAAVRERYRIAKASLAILNLIFGTIVLILHAFGGLISSSTRELLESGAEFCVCSAVWNVCLISTQVHYFIRKPDDRRMFSKPMQFLYVLAIWVMGAVAAVCHYLSVHFEDPHSDKWLLYYLYSPILPCILSLIEACVVCFVYASVNHDGRTPLMSNSSDDLETIKRKHCCDMWVVLILSFGYLLTTFPCAIINLKYRLLDDLHPLLQPSPLLNIFFLYFCYASGIVFVIAHIASRTCLRSE